MPPRVLVIGAGVGGLTAAALLLKAGYPVTVLEAHIYPGGSAGTFYHQGYHFDAGATLAGGFAPGGPHARVAEILGLEWPVRPADPAWVTHLPDLSITQWTSRSAWQAERMRAFPGSEPFWETQEHLANLAWDISSRPFPWPPTSPSDLFALMHAVRPQTVLAAPYLLRSLGSLLPHNASPQLRSFLDAQLLISAQTTAAHAAALYASAALDLPRRGVNHVQDGIGSLAKTLANWITSHGGQVLYRQQVSQIVLRKSLAAGVRTRKGLDLSADVILANLTPWGLAELLGSAVSAGLPKPSNLSHPMWGAFTLYLGLEAAQLTLSASEIPGQTSMSYLQAANHHQVIVDPHLPLGEGNSVFISLNDPLDSQRAPQGMRTATLSTHTIPTEWWNLFQQDPQAYAARKEEYTRRLLDAAEIALPGLKKAVRLSLPGTPVTFQRFTRRPLGMVGGFPQTSLFNARSPRTGVSNLFLVGDSTFPGQSTAGVTLGALRVAADVIRQFPIK